MDGCSQDSGLGARLTCTIQVPAPHTIRSFLHSLPHTLVQCGRFSSFVFPLPSPSVALPPLFHRSSQGILCFSASLLVFLSQSSTSLPVPAQPSNEPQSCPVPHESRASCFTDTLPSCISSSPIAAFSYFAPVTVPVSLTRLGPGSAGGNGSMEAPTVTERLRPRFRPRLRLWPCKFHFSLFVCRTLFCVCFCICVCFFFLVSTGGWLVACCSSSSSFFLAIPCIAPFVVEDGVVKSNVEISGYQT